MNLNTKVGPFPVWVWLVAGIGAFLLYRKVKGGAVPMGPTPPLQQYAQDAPQQTGRGRRGRGGPGGPQQY